MSVFHRTTLFKALKRDNGKIVVLDPAHLSATTKVVSTEREYEIAMGQGWTDSPQDAMDRRHAYEDDIAVQAAVSASDDRHLSEAAQQDALARESQTLEHVLEIKELPRKRGRPKKVQV